MAKAPKQGIEISDASRRKLAAVKVEPPPCFPGLHAGIMENLKLRTERKGTQEKKKE